MVLLECGDYYYFYVDHPKLLHVRVKCPRLSCPCYLTPIYAFCEAAIRKDLWMSLHHISLDMDDP